MYPKPFKRKGSPFYYFRLTIDGKRKLISTNKTLFREAQKFITQYVDSQKTKHVNCRLRDYIKPFLTYETNPRVLRQQTLLKKPGRSHIERQANHLKNHVLPDEIADKMIFEITPGDCIDFRTRISKKKPGKYNTINKILLSFKAVMSEAYIRGDISTNPAAHLGSLNYEQEQKDIFTVRETRKIFNDPSRFPSLLAYQAFRLAAFTGMRMSEVLALHWDQIDGDVLKINRAWKTKTTIGLPKRDKIRIIPLASSIMENLPDKTKSPLVFHHEDGERLGETWWRKNWLNIIIKYDQEEQPIRIKDVSENYQPHGLRHAVNTFLIKEGVPLQFIQTYLGWSRSTMNSNFGLGGLTKVQDMYTHIEADDMRIAAETIERLFTGKNSDSTDTEENVISFLEAKKNISVS